MTKRAQGSVSGPSFPLTASQFVDVAKSEGGFTSGRGLRTSQSSSRSLPGEIGVSASLTAQTTVLSAKCGDPSELFAFEKVPGGPDSLRYRLVLKMLWKSSK